MGRAIERQRAYLVLSSSLFIRAAIIFAHAHVLRHIGGLAFALSRSDGLGGIAHAAAVGRIGAAHDGNDGIVTRLEQQSVVARNEVCAELWCDAEKW